MVIMTHQNLRLGKCWKPFWATLTAKMSPSLWVANREAILGSWKVDSTRYIPSLSKPIRMTISNPTIWYILMFNVATIFSGAGDLKKENSLHSKQVKYGLSLSRRSEQISSACENLRFVLNSRNFLSFLLW